MLCAYFYLLTMQLELKEVPHYVTKKSIEDFFSIRGSRVCHVQIVFISRRQR